VIVTEPAPALDGAFSIDVEEHFQVAALSGQVAKHQWGSLPSRVEANTRRCLDLLAAAGVRGSFFVLGWVARRCPALVRQIAEAGHEVASHGMEHDRVGVLGPQRFAADVADARRLLEDACGAAVIGYRAPSFSIRPGMDWAYEALLEAGYRYSSSVYPVRHDHYGDPNAPRQAYRPLPDAELLEFPLSTARLAGRNLPASGGGYFRLLPYAASRGLLRLAGSGRARARIFYMHPWEVDPAQPRVSGLPLLSRFRHYVNLHRTQARVQTLLRDFAWDRMDRVFARELAQPTAVPATGAAGR
jgi:polysaccharide deacetylase family protein (PEP-CTERM system associated)